MWNPVIIQDLRKVGITAKKPSYGHRMWFDFPTSVGDIMAEFLFVRFIAAVSSSGIPIALTYDSTYGIMTATGTYAAGLDKSFGGLSIQNTGAYAAGDYGYVQVKGPNVVPVTSSAAMAANQGVQHTGSGTTVKTVAPATLAEVVCQFGLLLKAQAGAGTIGVGEMYLNKF